MTTKQKKAGKKNMIKEFNDNIRFVSYKRIEKIIDMRVSSKKWKMVLL
jgi:hypothetical protein